MKFRKKAADFLSLVFPKGTAEWSVFLLGVILYGLFGNYIAKNFTIIFDDRIPWDAYFSFDNRAIVMTGGGFERHPLANYFFDTLREIALWFSGGKKDTDFRAVLAMFSAVASSFAVLYVFKYLKNIIKIPLTASLLLTAFFALFTTPILLSFTPETYAYTLPLLIIFTYYAALMLRNGKKISGAALVLGGVAVGGLTITNIVKIYIPVLFENGIFRSWKKFLNAALRVSVSVTVFVLLYLNRLNFDVSRIFAKTGEQYEKFSNPKVTPFWDMVLSWFWGGNMLFPSFVIRDYHNKKGFHYKALFMDTYSAAPAYGFAITVFLMVIWSFFRNRRNPLVQLLMLTFSVDVIIHCVLKFGLHTAYIYGGHFIFIVPLMLGWLFYSCRNSPKLLSVVYVLMTFLLVFLGIGNYFRIEEFLAFLDAYYR